MSIKNEAQAKTIPWSSELRLSMSYNLLQELYEKSVL